MLIILIIQILKKTITKSGFRELKQGAIQFLSILKYTVPLLLISMNDASYNDSNVQNIKFDIVNKHKNVGFIEIIKTNKENTTTYEVNSEVETKVILKFKALGKEKSIYNNGTLVFSSVYRKLNSKVKVNQTLSLIDGNYYLKEAKSKRNLKLDPIQNNLVVLFFKEPIGVKQIYCDKIKKYVDILSLGSGLYKVVFSNKNHSIFHYKNGECILIEAVGTFYKVKLTPSINENNL